MINVQSKGWILEKGFEMLKDSDCVQSLEPSGVQEEKSSGGKLGRGGPTGGSLEAL